MFAMQTFCISTVLAGLCAFSSAQNITTVPATFGHSDAAGHLWLPGAGSDHRHQTIIGASHLSALVGQQLTAMEFRRECAAASYHW